MRRTILCVLGLLILGAAVLQAAEARHPVTAEELVRMTRLQDVAMSPNGRMVLYTAGRTQFPKSDKYVSHIYMVPAQGGAPRQMTAGKKGEFAPAWAPDGKSFAFLSRRNGSMQIFVIPVDGGEGRQIGDLKISLESRLKWAPDGKSIAFLAVPEPTPVEKAEEKRTGGVEIVEAPRDMAQLFVMSYPEGKVRQVTPGEYNVSEFSWSPDGRRFALMTARSQLLYDNMTEPSVRVIDTRGKTLAVLSKKPGPAQGAPVFSPDGTKVAWRYATKGLSDMNGVAVASADGGSLKDAAARVDYHFFKIAWMPDGKSLMALTMEGTRACFRRLDTATGKAPLVFAPAGVSYNFSLDKAGDRMAFSFTDPSSPMNPWTVKTDGSGARRLADLNPQVKNWLLPKLKKFHYESAPGVQIEALYAPAVAKAEPGTAPLMVMPHGGPDWMDQESFSGLVAYMTGHGYSVLRVNFRGSLSYGMKFYEANRGKEGFVDYDDIMAGVDYCVKHKLADPAKLVIGGWSYGGCMTEWAICRTHRFKAAVVGAGVSDYISNYAESDINHGLAGEWEFLGNPYDNPENYMKDSSIFHIRAVQTPVLILHGKDDTRVPYSQGLELYRALKTTGKQVEMVAYPGENHGFRKPEHQIDRMKRWLAYYDKILGIERKTGKKEGAAGKK